MRFFRHLKTFYHSVKFRSFPKHLPIRTIPTSIIAAVTFDRIKSPDVATPTQKIPEEKDNWDESEEADLEEAVDLRKETKKPKVEWGDSKKKRRSLKRREIDLFKLNSQILAAQEVVEKECIKQGIPGASACVMIDGQVIYTDAYGYLDIDHRVKVNPNTLMHIASISKAMTAMSIAKLYDLGFLKSFDKPICDIIPMSSPLVTYPLIVNNKHITIKQLLNHTSGIRHYASSDEFLSTHPTSTMEATFLSTLAREKLLFKPGEGYKYSSFGYILLGILIQYLTQMDYAEYVEKHLFAELGMNSTYHESDAGEVVLNRTLQYCRNIEKNSNTDDICDNKKLTRLQQAPWANISKKASAGAFISNALDVAKFAHNCVLGDYLSEAVQKEVFETNLVKCTKKSSQPDDYYGLGWHVFIASGSGETNNKDMLLKKLKLKRKGDEKEPYMISHGGGAVGGSSFVMVLPEYQMVVAVITNLQESSPSLLAKKIACCFISDEEANDNNL